MLKKVQMMSHKWLCVLACFFVAICDWLQSLVTCNTADGQFEGSAGVGGFVVLSLATQWLDGLRGVLVWEVLSRVLVTWYLLYKGFLCNLEHHTEYYLKITKIRSNSCALKVEQYSVS
jgi:hypothetical protein